ncbi:MAG: fumarylacetoacetate hydrolase [Burkholderiales bacterium]
MKLATYDDGSSDGQLIVVARDLTTAHYASDIARRLQQVLDDWNFLAPQLEALSISLNQGRARHAFAFDPARCLAPLPRVYHWRDSGGTDTCVRPGDTARAALGSVDLHEQATRAWAHVGLAFITGGIGQGTVADVAIEGVRLLMLVQAWRRDEAARLPADLSAHACAPVLLTPDELGADWQGGRARLALSWRIDGRRVPAKDAAAPAHWPANGHAGGLLAQAAQGAAVGRGTVLVSFAESLPSISVERGRRLRLEAVDAQDQSLFGAIEQAVGEGAQSAEGPADDVAVTAGAVPTAATDDADAA